MSRTAAALFGCLALWSAACPGFQRGGVFSDAAALLPDASLPDEAGSGLPDQPPPRDGGTFDTPAGACLTSDKRCGADHRPETCTGGQWVAGQPCSFACTGRGECTGICKPGTTQCSGSDGLTPQLCEQSGSWTDLPRCRNLCARGSCGGSCVPGTRRCGANDTPETCDQMGTWEGGPQCPANRACRNGLCSTSECRPGYKLCGTDCVLATLCCPGTTMECFNRCNQRGSRPCNGGTWGACSAVDASCCTPTVEVCNGRDDDCDDMIDECPSGESCVSGKCEKPCGVRGGLCCSGEGRKCSSRNDFCCDLSVFCSAGELNRCQERRGAGEFCNYALPDELSWCTADHFCSGDTDLCSPNAAEGEFCGLEPGFPRCRPGLYCDNNGRCRKY